MTNVTHPSESKSALPLAGNKKLKVDVIAEGDPGKLFFYLQPGDPETQKYLKGKTLTFKPGPDWFDIEYRLDDSDSNVRLMFKQAEPMCAHEGTACPGKNSGINTNDQICVEDTKDKTLTVRNKNQDPPTKFAYTLFFTDLDGVDVGELDPIYDNGGGGNPIER